MPASRPHAGTLSAWNPRSATSLQASTATLVGIVRYGLAADGSCDAAIRRVASPPAAPSNRRPRSTSIGRGAALGRERMCAALGRGADSCCPGKGVDAGMPAGRHSLAQSSEGSLCLAPPVDGRYRGITPSAALPRLHSASRLIIAPTGQVANLPAVSRAGMTPVPFCSVMSTIVRHGDGAYRKCSTSAAGEAHMPRLLESSTSRPARLVTGGIVRRLVVVRGAGPEGDHSCSTVPRGLVARRP